ncbi:MAG: hypothetical protein ABGX03_07610 [Methylophilaceae bacterium]
MSMSKKPIAIAVGGAFALTLGTAAIAATDNPFEIKTLSSGYQVADNHAKKGGEGKCGEGKCGEGKCGADKTKDGKCGEEKCNGEKKMEDGKCGEGKCGEGKRGK